jgi:RHS repeat-associated protein
VKNRWYPAAKCDAKVEWDFEDRLVKVTKSDGTVVENVYDVDGVLVRTAVNGVGTEYLVDTSGGLSHVVAEVDGSGVVAVLYVRAGDMLLEEIRGGVAKMYEADGLGSVRGLLDVSGARTDTYSYEAFGTILSSTGSDANPYRFAGERLVDSVGFYQNRARWLDTRTGRFVSVDPMLGLNDGDPSALQPYLYAGARPTTNSDPTGLVSLTEGMAVHQAIGDHFVGQKFLKRTSDISISSILEQPGASRLRPDLVDSENFSIFEIKTIRGATAGAAQLAKYIAVMRVLDKQNGYNWHVGTPGEYQPPPMVPISILRTASVNPPSGGLILYDVYDNNLRRGPQDHTLPYLIMIMVLTVVLSPLGV